MINASPRNTALRICAPHRHPTNRYNFYTSSLSFSAKTRFAARRTLRTEWLDGAAATAQGAELLFLDPDNGLECGASRYAKDGPKNTFTTQIKPAG
jgi:hypothetical protein